MLIVIGGRRRWAAFTAVPLHSLGTRWVSGPRHGSFTPILRINLQPENQVVYRRFLRGEGKCHGRQPPFPGFPAGSLPVAGRHSVMKGGYDTDPQPARPHASPLRPSLSTQRTKYVASLQ